MTEVTLVEAVCLALARVMAEDDSVLVLGEDVGVDGGDPELAIVGMEFAPTLVQYLDDHGFDPVPFEGASPEDAEAVNQHILDLSPSAEGMTVESLKKTGIAKYRNVGGMGIQENLFNSDWKGEGVMRSLTDMSEQRWRWPTLTGRQQCYIDHPWFIDAGESLPDHKESPKAGGDHPFQFSTRDDVKTGAQTGQYVEYRQV